MMLRNSMLRAGVVPWIAVMAIFAVAVVAMMRPASKAWQAHAATVGPLTRACPAPKAGNDYTGLTLVLCNFNRANLKQAKFANATLTAIAFDGADLTDADFSGATIADSGNAMLPTDFSFAILTNAHFKQTKFQGRTYFTYATISCTDFSDTDISISHAVFGPAPLNFDRNAGCRPTFTGATINCEFIADWPALDLTGAKGVNACATQLAGRDFSNAKFAGVDFSNIDLSNTTWTHANLSQAIFDGATLDGAKGLGGDADNASHDPSKATYLLNASFQKASIKNVDFSNGLLYGAVFTRAELQGANFSNAVLSGKLATPADPTISGAATFNGAHLKFANFVGATLQGVSFRSASIYGGTGLIYSPPSQCKTVDPSKCGGNQSCPADYKPCSTGSVTGWTCSCATMSGANLSGTDFTNAFLYGVDFTGSATQVVATDFSNAVLVGANFNGASFRTDAVTAKVPTLDAAFLQGVDLSALTLQNPNSAGISLAGAYVDFGVTNAQGKTMVGNSVFFQLTPDHVSYPGAPQSPPCVATNYPTSSQFNTQDGAMTCPNLGKFAGGCGPMKPSGTLATAPKPNSNWYGGPISAAVPIKAWYFNDSTYDKAPAFTQLCAGQQPDTTW